MPDEPKSPTLSRTLSATYVVVRAIGLKNFLFASLDDCTIRAIDLDTQLVRTLQEHESPAFSLDIHGDHLASGGSQEHADILIWSISNDFTPTNMLTGHSDTIRALKFSSDGQTLASASRDGAVRVWTSEDGVFSCSHILPDHDSPVYATDWLGSKLLSAGADGKVRFWDVEKDFEASGTLDGKGNEIRYTASNEDGDRLIAAPDAKEPTVRVWVGESNEPTDLEGLEGMVNRVNFQGQTLVATDNSGNVAAWKPSLEQVYKVKAGPKSITAWTPLSDGKRFATGCADSPVKVWDLESGKLLWQSPKEYDVIWALYSPDEHRIAALAHEGGRAKVELWRVS